MVDASPGPTDDPGLGFDAYPKPSLAVDPVVLTVHAGTLWTALCQRRHAPWAGQWALPGVFVNLGESFSIAVARALRAKLGIESDREPVQLQALNRVDRDPRGWVVAVAYYLVIPFDELEADLSDNPEADLFAIGFDGPNVPGGRRSAVVRSADGDPIPLAFDHADIVDLVVGRIQGLIWSDLTAFSLLPERFTLRRAQSVFETIMGYRLNKDSFRRRVTKSLAIVEATGEMEQGVDHRPAELYRVVDPARRGW